MSLLHGQALVGVMCIAQVCNLLPHVVVPAIMAHHLMPLWHLSAAQAGMMASAYAFGYMLAVPVLTALRDRYDARGILLAGSAVSGLATIAFGLFADGLLSASLIWGVAGAGFGGAYMPGLKALMDRLPPGDASRSVTLYTASFSVGVGLSFLVSQLVADFYGWRAAFFVTGIAPAVMVSVCLCSRRSSRSLHRAIRSISVRFSAIARPSATSSAMARIVLNSMACARGSCPSGRSLPPAMQITCC